MWSPTHIQVTILKAKNLLTKGKHGTNNCFVTIALGKEKYQTSVKDKASENVDWHEECELSIPERGNRAELILTCLHRNNLGIDEFLGQTTLPLNEMDAYERPRPKWYKLESKPGKEKKKERGELEVRINFTVKAGSLTDLSKKEKHKSSISKLATSVGGSLLSLGTIEKKKGIGKFAKSIGSKLHLSSKSKKNKDGGDSDSFTGSFASIGTPNSSIGGGSRRFGQKNFDDPDPGVISEDEDEFRFDNLSHKSSGSSLNINRNNFQRVPSPLLSKEDANLRAKTLPPIKPPRNPSDTKLDDWESKLYGKNHLEIGSSDSLKRRSWESSRVPLPTKEHLDEKPEIVLEEEKETKSQELEKTKEFIQNETKSQEAEKPIEFMQPKQEITREVTKKEEITKQNVIEQKVREAENIPTELPAFSKKPLDDVRNIANEKITKKIASPKPSPLPRSATTSNLSSSVENIYRDKSKKDEKTEKKSRFSSKLKYFKRDKSESVDDFMSSERKFVEQRHNPIGHENVFVRNEPSIQSPELSQELLNRYDGKSREEIIVYANGLENEVIIQRNRVKELEDYLDDLLLRVMETHPKILQNPYRTTSTKSG